MRFVLLTSESLSAGRPIYAVLCRLVVCVGVATGLNSAAAEDLVGLYLNWNDDPTTTMTINWVDIYSKSSTTVWHRKVEAGDWSTAEAKKDEVGPTTLQLRRLELKGLEPGTLYEFGIGDTRKDVSHFWRFRTMPAELKEPLRFVAGGDTMHTRAMVDAMNGVMQKLDPDFTVLYGDLAYENGVNGTRWIDWLQSWKQHSVAKGKRLIPLVVGIGNHEVKGHYNGKAPDDAPYFYSLFALPKGRSYFALDFGKYLSLVVLDSQHTQPIPGAQADWLKQTLAERSAQQFLFAGYHYPAYGTTKAPPGKLPIDAPQSIAIREHWMPHFERYGVSAVFENDHHNFKRSHRLRGHKRDDENGLLYLGDGSWGVQTREVPSLDVAWWLAKAEPRNHLWQVEIRPDGTATIEARDAAGEVFDRVELEKPRTVPVAE
ncbi:MAG: metallophosphoesterase family protein [Pirellulales bacterium]|nr:metallophosphoesterase family protein [Pirellulales bacterium]